MTTYRKFVWARRITSLAVFSALLCWVLSSCEQDKLCYDHSHPNELIVYFTWEEVYEESPASMFLYLFLTSRTRMFLKGNLQVTRRVGVIFLPEWGMMQLHSTLTCVTSS